MPKHKTLKSVAHNLGYSFTSLMNYQGNDYVLGHLQRQMLNTGINKLEINLLKNDSLPKELVSKEIQNAIDIYVDWLPKLVSDCKSDMSFVEQAMLTVEFDFNQSRICSSDSRYVENPFVCISKIIDNNGKEYKYEFRDWWFPESLKKEQLVPKIFEKLTQWLKKI